MNKQEFLARLRDGLSALPPKESQERLNFYSEMIDDRMEEGLAESEAVAAVGDVEQIVCQAMNETAVQSAPQKRKLKAWEIVLLVLGAPLWISLLIAAASVVFSIYVSVWAVILSLWAAFASLIACAFGGVVSGIVFAFTVNIASGLLMISVASVCAGFGVFMFFACKAATKGTVLLTKKLFKKEATVWARRQKRGLLQRVSLWWQDFFCLCW